MEIKRMTIENKTLEPWKPPAATFEKAIQTERGQSAITFTPQSNIVTKGNEIGILLAALSDGIVLKEAVLKEVNTVLQLFLQLHALVEKGKQSEQIYEQIVMNLRGLIQQANVKGIPLLDGTYDFILIPMSSGRQEKQVVLSLLDVSQLVSKVEQDPTQLNLILGMITSYITKVSNETSSVEAIGQPKDATVLRALAEMNMTQLARQLKEVMQQHKWSVTVCFLFIWMICILLIGVS